MSESIVIEGLRIHARHGVLPQERRVGNVFEIDLRLDFDATAAMTTDRVESTVNYAEVVEVVEREMAVPSDLLEHVAGRIRTAICHHFPQITSGRLALYKIHPPMKAQLGRIGFIINW